ncbi:MAG: efflux RND transporter periplasmic adaptor subunit [Candidatus Acidiferrales bacterium]
MTEPSIYARTATEPAATPTQATLRSAFSADDKPHRTPQRNKPFAAILALVVIAVAALLFVVFRKGQARASASADAGTATAVTKDFVSVLRLAGSTEALRSRPVLAPELSGAQLSTMVVTKLLPGGTLVRKGDLLVEFDRQAQIKDALDKKAAYQDLVDQVAEKRAAEDAARAKDQDDLQQAQDALQKAQLEMGKNEILSRIDVEKNQEALAEAQETLKQLQHTFDLKRQAAAADIRTLEIQRDRARATMLYAESNANKMSIVSPMGGVVVLNSIWLGSRIGEVQEGDEVRPGVPFMKVVDPSAMQVRVGVNQADLLKLHLGQHAQISLDAYPGVTFPGTLEELAPLGQASEQSDTIRNFTAVFSIQGANSKLMPDLSAAVDLQLANLTNALVVPAEGVEHEAGRDYVWLKTGGAFIRRAVTAGPTNGLETVIEAGLKPHDVVRLTPQLGQGPS